MNRANDPFIQRVRLRNYKSIRKCDVCLGPLTFLVGPNGSGKSNFLEALRFLSESLQVDMQHAVDNVGQVRDIFWRGEEESTEFSIELDLNLSDGGDASYKIVVGEEDGLFVIEAEQCSVRAPNVSESAEFRVEKGHLKTTRIPTPPPASESRLYLTTVSGYPEFSDVYRLLRGMRFFNISPEEIRREACMGKPERELRRNGKGALFAAHRAFGDDHVKTRVQEYLQALLPSLSEVRIETTHTSIGSRHGTPIRPTKTDNEDVVAEDPKSLKFLFEAGLGHSAFDPQNISDGTLRAFGVLLALFQCLDPPANDPIRLVGIEEPEAALHPAAAGVLFDALREASHFTQVLVTTHSPDLLDMKDLDVDSLLVVDMVEGRSVIGPADDASRSIMRDRLSTAGELLRQDQLRPRNQAPGTVGAESD